jgi:hypothetical protein
LSPVLRPKNKSKLIISVKIKHLTETEYILIKKNKSLNAKYIIICQKEVENGGDVGMFHITDFTKKYSSKVCIKFDPPCHLKKSS